MSSYAQNFSMQLKARNTPRTYARLALIYILVVAFAWSHYENHYWLLLWALLCTVVAYMSVITTDLADGYRMGIDEANMTDIDRDDSEERT